MGKCTLPLQQPQPGYRIQQISPWFYVAFQVPYIQDIAIGRVRMFSGSGIYS